MVDNKQTEPLSEDALKKVIQEIFKSGEIVPSKHARKRMQERGYSLADVRHIIKYGALIKTERGKEQYYIYHLHGKDIEGHQGGAVVALVKESKLIIVTVKGGT